ncbi:MAG: damage-inducible mutasis protein, partial [Microvirga sp.]|nr:damage-inducible mutasis protein [Microvirga sp.]
MLNAGQALALSELRERIGRLESRGRSRKALPFGVRAVDRHLPGGGLALDSLHEVMETGFASEHAAVATLFVAGILARNKGPVLWCLSRRDLFAPALAGAGLHPDRIIYAETLRETEVLAVVEEGLRERGLAGVVGEVSRLGLTASRRLQLAAEGSGVP